MDGRYLARARRFDVDTDSGMMMLSGVFEYGEDAGSGQGLGYIIDATFIHRFMSAFGVSRLQDVNNKPCWVTVKDGLIVKIEPLFSRDGTPFDIEIWSTDLRLKKVER